MIKKILSYSKKKRKHFYIAMLLIFLSTLSLVGAFVMTYLMVDGLLSGEMSSVWLMHLAVGLATCLVLQGALKAVGLRHSHIFAYEALGEIRRALAAKMLKNPLGTTLKHSAGSYRSKIVDHVEQIEILLAHGFPEGIPYVMSTVLIYVLIFVLDFRLGLLALVPLVISSFLMSRMFRNAMTKMLKYIEASKNMSGNIVEFIRGIEVIKIFNRRSSSYQKITDSVYAYRDFTLSWFRESWNTMALIGALAPTVILLVLPFGILFVMDGSLPFSKLVFVCLLCFSASTPVTKLQHFVPVLGQLHQKINDLEEDFYAQELITGEEVLKDAPLSIAFDRVHFSYDKSEVIKGASFEIEPGMKVAFVGESGSGKSTLAKLLLHYYDVDEGEIRIGGKPLTALRLESLMDHISYVSQENFLFDMSIRQNILLGKPDATEKELHDAAKAAHIHAFIQGLEHGYETKVGDGGNKLSGGEKQRICIARAIIKNAPIVILDEATSYTDPENEYYIERAIQELLKDKTVIVIAHKLSKIKHCDRIILLDDGAIAATGSHEELLRHPLYRNLWNRYQGARNYAFRAEKSERIGGEYAQHS